MLKEERAIRLRFSTDAHSPTLEMNFSLTGILHENVSETQRKQNRLVPTPINYKVKSHARSFY